MNPRSFRKWKGLTVHQMAEQVGCANGGVVSKYERAQHYPAPEVQERYRIFSDGLVQPSDWHDLWMNKPVPGDIEDLRTPEELEERKSA